MMFLRNLSIYKNNLHLFNFLTYFFQFMDNVINLKLI